MDEEHDEPVEREQEVDVVLKEVEEQKDEVAEPPADKERRLSFLLSTKVASHRGEHRPHSGPPP